MLNSKYQSLKILPDIYLKLLLQCAAQNTGSQLSLKELKINWRKNCQEPGTIPLEVMNHSTCFSRCFLFVAFEQDKEKILNDKVLKVVTADFMYLQQQATVRCVGTGWWELQFLLWSMIMKYYMLWHKIIASIVSLIILHIPYTQFRLINNHIILTILTYRNHFYYLLSYH